ncbi:AMP-binding protein [Enterovibrio nigricans]|uniref:Amino acid adenylation domain-containing protein n=1 Tax=Enterovibrio nigricans DSM 22720 TaxID=1121868 RepID=A0A1T4V4C3_9GAMM|nr:AMP-binding protein [Enterovibrio nigricans]PKF50458.1 peptide synthetase [Enterovibrio nigricans]SKA59839.1 amino acid adenylation domain-containing protein [Enterovibrio nigricans DSM 22720]
MTAILNSVLFPPSPSEQSSAQGCVFNLAPLSMLSAQDRRKFVTFGRSQTDTPLFSTLNQAFEYHAKCSPYSIAAIQGNRAISYAALNQQAEKLATLLQKARIKHGDSVGIFLTQSVNMLTGMLACLKVGANYVPQHTGVAPPEQLHHIVNMARIKVVLTVSTQRKMLPEFNDVILLELDTLLKSHKFRSLAIDGKRPTKPDDLSFIFFTSGTTGAPNGVQVTHRNICNIILTDPGNLGVKQGTRVAQIQRIDFALSAWEIYVALCHGGTLLISDDIIEHTTSNANVIIATPPVLEQINPNTCEDVKVVVAAGEPCPRLLAEKWAKQCRLYAAYGTTETTIINTAKWYAPGDTLTLGKPTTNNTVYILDEHLKPCDIGDIGELWVGGECVTKGYLANASLSQEKYRPDPFLGDRHVMFRTCDLAQWTKDGELEHVSRSDGQIETKRFCVKSLSGDTLLEK